MRLTNILNLLAAICIQIAAWGQPVSSLPDDLKAYPPNAFEKEINLAKSDSSCISTARLLDIVTLAPLPARFQPRIYRTGLKLKISWATTDGLPTRSILEVLCGSAVRFKSYLRVAKDPNFISQPGALTVISPFSATLVLAAPIEPVTTLTIWQQLMKVFFN